MLQQKDHNRMLLGKVSQGAPNIIRAPSILEVIQSAVSDVPVSIGEKKFIHLMLTVATALHGRCQEMSSLHFQLAFILAHGGCTQRVICLSIDNIQQNYSVLCLYFVY